VLIFLAVFLGLQLLIPLRYYLGSDPYDERFSWRMFSAVRVHRCQVSVVETVADQPRPVDLARAIHFAWINTLERNRDSVVKKFLQVRCARDDVSEVTLTNHCVTPDGTRIEPIVWTRDCASGELSEPEIRLDPGGDS
jgi:hypothetical protein